MNHETAWAQLPDLLCGRPGGALRAHVGACHACQKQLFRLARVDALLRQYGRARPRRGRAGGRAGGHTLAAACAIAAAAAVAAVTLLPPPSSSRTRFVLRAASGAIVAHGGIARADAENRLISLDARGLPRRLGNMYLLWARTGEGRRLVGRFMVDQTGSCHVVFSLPRGEQVKRFWVAPEEAPNATIAST